MSRRSLIGALGFVAVMGVALFFYLRQPIVTPGPKLESDELPFVVVGPPWFRDMTAASGVNFIHRNGEEAGHYAVLESLGGGVALLDYDGDGLLDIFVTGGGHYSAGEPPALNGLPCKLYRNRGGWKFDDVTDQVGLKGPWWYTHGVAVADYDRDGWPDLLVTGYGKIAMFHNDSDGKGGRRFVDVTEKLGLRDELWSTSAGWADLDGDGYPDLYVCHYCDWSPTNHPKCYAPGPGKKRDICPPQWFKPQVHALWHNDKGKAFRNVAAEHGFKAEGHGLGVLLTDLNDDGRPDIYVANDTDNNLLYWNRGGKLEERGMAVGAAVNENGVPDGSMGVDAGDYDGTGRPSLFVTNFQGELHALYRHRGGENFLHQSRATGFGRLGNHFVGFGTSFLDLDNDGWEDLVVVNGHAMRHPTQGGTYHQRPVLLRNVPFQGRRFFQDISPQGGEFFKNATLGRGLAVGDLDNDGWPDVVVCHTNSPVAILRNEAAAGNPAQRWLGVRLIGKNHRDVVGSTVILEIDGRKLTRYVKGGGSYLSANDSRILFGLGASTAMGRVTVKWSWGATEAWADLKAGAYCELHEGKAEARHAGQ